MSQGQAPSGAAEPSASLTQRASKISLLVLDVDGVLTDGRLYYGAEGEALKVVDVRDGHGLVMLREHKVPFAILSGRPQPLLHRRFEELGCVKVIERCYRKSEVIAELAEERGLTLDALAFIGDDLNDLGALSKVGLSAAPADAVPEVREAVDFLCQAKGGQGAVRELCELLLKSQGKWPPW